MKEILFFRRPVSARTRHSMTICVPRVLLREVKKRAAAYNLSLSELSRICIERGLLEVTESDPVKRRRTTEDQLNIRISPSLHEQLRIRAERQATTVSAVVRQLLQYGLDNFTIRVIEDETVSIQEFGALYGHLPNV